VAVDLIGRQKVDGHAAARVVARSLINGARAQRHVDVRIQKRHAVRSAPNLVNVHRLVADLQVKRFGERSRHQHQRQAVSAPCVKRLRRIARGQRVVVEFELIAPIKRRDQAARWAVAAQLPRDVKVQIACHRVAHRKHVLGLDSLRRRFEKEVAKEGGGLGCGL